MPKDFIYPIMPRKQIELWGIKSTSGNFRPYQIQTANIHFNIIGLDENSESLKILLLMDSKGRSLSCYPGGAMFPQQDIVLDWATPGHDSGLRLDDILQDGVGQLYYATSILQEPRILHSVCGQDLPPR